MIKGSSLQYKQSTVYFVTRYRDWNIEGSDSVTNATICVLHFNVIVLLTGGRT